MTRADRIRELGWVKELCRLGVDTDRLDNESYILQMRDGRSVSGTYLNANKEGTVYLTLRSNYDLTPDPALWVDLDDSEVKETNRDHWNVTPRGSLRLALEQLFRSGGLA